MTKNNQETTRHQLAFDVDVEEHRPPFTAVELFSGPGGLGLGLSSAGFRMLAAVEMVESCVQTYQRNHPDTVVIHKDVRDVKESDIVALVKQITGDETVDLVAGGPPCETFSTAGPGIRSTRDHRDHLFRDLVRIAGALNSKYVLIENIPGLKSKKADNGDEEGIFKDVLCTLIEAGFYRYDFRVLTAANYGVPQLRDRLFILATSDPDLPLRFPEPTHGPGRSRPWVTVEEALGDLPSLEIKEEKETYSGEPACEFQKIMRSSAARYGEGLVFPGKHLDGVRLTQHEAPNHRAPTIERYKMIRPGEGLKDLMTRLDEKRLAELQNRRVLPKKWYIQRDRRLVADKPSMTITSHCLDEPLHPVDHRHLSPREVARLQSFPDWYYFEGPRVVPHIAKEQDVYEQIGDAVPPLLALAIGREIAKGLSTAIET